MTPSRRRSIVVGLVLGLAVSVLIAVVLSRDGDGSAAVLGTPGSQIGGAIPTAADVRGRSLPNQSFTAFDGREVKLADFAGRPLVLNVWSSTCAPCVREMPAFEQVHRELGEAVTIVGVNNADRADQADALAAETGVTYPLVRDPNGDFFAEMELAAMPTTLFVDSTGTVVRTRAGALGATELRDLIRSELGV